LHKGRRKSNNLRIGSKIIITASDNENYKEYLGKEWVVEDIAKNIKEHPLYDEGVGGKLISCKGLPFSLYEWEFEVV
jgi:hypothetical protein